MKRKILSLALALMMIVSVVTALPVSAEVQYLDDGSIILDVADLQRESADQPNYTTIAAAQIYTSWGALSAVDWSTAVAVDQLTGKNSTFNFEVAKTGIYDIILAGNGRSTTPQNATVDIDGTNVISSVSVDNTAGEHTLGRVTMEKGSRALKITGNLRMYNIKLAFVEEIVVVDGTEITGSIEAAGDYFVMEGSSAALGGSATNKPTQSGTFTNVTWADVGAATTAGPTYTLTYNFTIDKPGSYKIYLATASAASSQAMRADLNGTQVVSQKTLTTSTSANDVVETDFYSAELVAGDYSLTLYAGVWNTIYVFDVKVEAVSMVDPSVLNLGSGQTAVSGTQYTWATTGWTTNNTTWATVGCTRIYQGAVVQFDYTVEETGYYNIKAAAGNYSGNGAVRLQLQSGGNDVLSVNSCTITKNSESTSAIVVDEFAWGVHYIPAGTYTVQLTASLSTVQIYNLKFEYASEQTPTTFCIKPAQAASYSGAQLYPYNNYTTNNTGESWVAQNGSSTLGSIEGNYLTYKIYVNTPGYYDICMAVGTESISNYNFYVNDKLIADCEKTVDIGDMSAVGIIELAKVYIPAGNTAFKLEVAHMEYPSSYYIYGLKASLSGTQPSADGVRLIKQNGLSLDESIIEGSKVFAEVKTELNSAKLIIAHYSDDTETKTMIDAAVAAPVTFATDGNTKILRTSLTLTESGGIVKAFLWTDDGKYIPLSAADSFELTIPAEDVE